MWTLDIDKKWKVEFSNNPIAIPGFQFAGINVGIKNKTKDLGLVYSEHPLASAAVFTKNSFLGAPLIVAKRDIFAKPQPKIQALIVNSKNANVATALQGEKDVISICKSVAKKIKVPEQSVMMSSTGIIGEPLPRKKILDGINQLCLNLGYHSKHIHAFGQSILTSDKKKKICSATIYYYPDKMHSKRAVHDMVSQKEGNRVAVGRVMGIAKGAGMIEPNMGTMLAYVFTDIPYKDKELKSLIEGTTKKTFNTLSIDGDTSTSDTFAIFSGTTKSSTNQTAQQEKKPPIPKAIANMCIMNIAQSLCFKIASDGEGKNKVIILDICNAKSEKIASKLGKDVINSLLVKTALQGADPNWGRIIMALGKSGILGTKTPPPASAQCKTVKGSNLLKISLIDSLEKQMIHLYETPYSVQIKKSTSKEQPSSKGILKSKQNKTKYEVIRRKTKSKEIEIYPFLAFEKNNEKVKSRVKKLTHGLCNDCIHLKIELNQGKANKRLLGNSLSKSYVHFNSMYTS